MTVKQSNNNRSKNLTLIRLYGLRSCEAFTYIWLKENLLLSIYFCIPITTFLFGQRSLVQKVSYTLIQNVVILIISGKWEIWVFKAGSDSEELKSSLAFLECGYETEKRFPLRSAPAWVAVSSCRLSVIRRGNIYPGTFLEWGEMRQDGRSSLSTPLL